MNTLDNDQLSEQANEAIAEVILATKTTHTAEDVELVVNQFQSVMFGALFNLCKLNDITGTDAMNVAARCMEILFKEDD